MDQVISLTLTFMGILFNTLALIMSYRYDRFIWVTIFAFLISLNCAMLVIKVMDFPDNTHEIENGVSY